MTASKYLKIAAMASLVFMVFHPLAVSGSETLLYEYDSVYHHIRVVQDGPLRGLRFDNNFYQSKVDIVNPLTGHFHYIDLLFQSFLFQPEPDNVVILGLGGGSAGRLLHHHQPELDILTVELDPAVVDVAEEFFFYDRDVLPVEISDARAWLRRSNAKYDLIIQDTYSSNTYGTFIPFHLATLEYFSLVYNSLTDDGIFTINVIGTVYGGEQNRIISSVYRTMHEVFPQLYMFAADDVQNVVIIATRDEERLSKSELLTRAIALTNERRSEFPMDFTHGTAQFQDTVPSGLSSAMILTDDYAPTDNLLR